MEILPGRVLSPEDFPSEDAPVSDANPQKKKEEGKERVGRFYLPVLNLNKPEHWDPLPAEERRHFTDHVAAETCLHNCCGYPGLKSACCTLDPSDLEHILGPVDEKWVKKMVKWSREHGQPLATRADIVIDFEEGKVIGETHFGGHRIFKSPESYPMIRIQVMGPRFCCKFLNSTSGKCMIYEHRPDMCRNYYCGYVQTRFLVRTKAHPNRYVKMDGKFSAPNSDESADEK